MTTKSGESRAEPAGPASPTRIGECVNDRCPWSGDPVQADSLARYRGRIVGFCNTGCRDKFLRAITTFDEIIGCR